MTGILNLTKDAVRIGDVTIEPSGYVARVEYDRRLSVREPICEANDGGYITIGSDDIPIYEQTPREIVVDHAPWKQSKRISTEPVVEDQSDGSRGFFYINPNALLIVEREVAEAAALKTRRLGGDPMKGKYTYNEEHHPLASRMVWAANPVFCDPNFCGLAGVKPGEPTPYHANAPCLIGYRELRRVGGVG